ncbi:hypothetical protein [Lysinibacillus pakistanensis]|uniref:LPXTG cell wall anchor domain-containing protein n=1 Tax=Lysinibacillus pakistanensis TaxID=759811 RepID=A0AAX3WW97_9BACI|nr:hypothetical protein [Lysinibacillus pakistanensis]MDM5230071.1 hypothetical protein [Lysinibacillus pakistanensis]WHY45669.1 hypothetical protein QNH22_20695 [Lysinibacillus pakistanensis]WHY50677.1 hypothetical protein QNH24_20660 [Lysinibacillus pakistanensis]
MGFFKYITIISLIILILSTSLFIREKQIEIAIHDQFVESLQTERESNGELESSDDSFEQSSAEVDDNVLEQLSVDKDNKNLFLVVTAFSTLLLTLFSGSMWYRTRKRKA